MFDADVMRRDVSGWKVRWDEDRAAAYRASGVWSGRTLADFARERAEAQPDQQLLFDQDRWWTASELYGEARALAGALVRRGLRPGQVVSYQLPNWREAHTVSLACAMAGLVSNPIPPILRDAELSFVLPDCGSRLLFIPGVYRDFDYPAMLERIRDAFPEPVEVVVVRGEGSQGLGYEALLSEGDVETALPDVDPDAIKLVMYTSGTTGRPKGVLHSHHTLQAENHLRADWLGLGPDDRILVASSIAHITGNLYALTMPWIAGVGAVLIDRWNPERAFALARDHGCTMINGAPFLEPLLRVAQASGQDLSRLRYFSLGGTVVPRPLIAEAAEVFGNAIVFRAYGATEVPTITLGVRDPAAKELGLETDGPIGGAEVRIVDPVNGRPAAPGEEGEIRARGPQSCLGYLHEADNDGAFDDDGFFRMGDLGRVVEGGYLQVTGRIKDLIIRSGENISAREIEDVLYRHEDVTEVAVVAAPHPRTGETAAAFVVLRPGGRLDFAEMQAFVSRAGLARQKTPEHLFVVDALPRNENGKVRKDQLRDEARRLSAGPGN